VKHGAIIAPEDVPRVFNDAMILVLAREARLPPDADQGAFARGIRHAVRVYLQEVMEPNANDLHREVQALECAASERDFDRVAELLEGMSPRCREMMTRRCSTPGFQSWRSEPATLPSAEDLRHPARREEALNLVWTLCVSGGGAVEGRWRRRSDGTRYRSRTWRVRLAAPEPRRSVKKRGAELTLVMMLQVAWTEATGDLPSMTAHHSAPGPFARMVRKCFALIGIPAEGRHQEGGVDVIGLINELQKRRKAHEAQKK
jgi:hypothetical protein